MGSELSESKPESSARTQLVPAVTETGEGNSELSGSARLRAPAPEAGYAIYPGLALKALHRSLFVSAGASALGAIFIAAIQGSVLNFFLGDLGYTAQLSLFLGLTSLSALGSMMGPWLQNRLQSRRGVFMWLTCGSRFIWLAIGLVPLLWPDWTGPSRGWALAALILLFWLTHSIGSNAWLSWMGDLVPPHLAGRYWGLRQLACSLTAGLARMGFGWYLDAHRNPDGYMTIFTFALIFGAADILLFFFVEHREPKFQAGHRGMLNGLRGVFENRALRRLMGVYLLWSLSNAVLAAPLFRFMHDQVHMGPRPIAMVETMYLATMMVFSLLWGHFADRHGQRGTLCCCLLVHALCPIFYYFAGPGSWSLVALSFAIGGLSFCGVQLFMTPMLLAYTRSASGGREIGIAAFTLVIGVPCFLAFWLTDAALCPGLSLAFGTESISDSRIYMAINTLVMVLRFGALGLALALPAHASELAPGAVVQLFTRTNPVRACWGLVRYLNFGWRRGPGPFSVPE